MEHDLRLPRRAADLFPPVEEARVVHVGNRFGELGQDERKLELRFGCRRAKGDAQRGRLAEEVVALDVKQLLHLRHGAHGLRGGLRVHDLECSNVLDLRDEVGERRLGLVTVIQSQPTKMSMILGLDANLDVRVLVEDTLGEILQLVIPLVIAGRQNHITE
ncbi:LOW QUALITY PROTEIN: hypothetical protein BC936DRAFT_137036 [Jimgerdemannia flammicorona]|uniref:Uncharacterized protein n=1 Tax=Jimgerdemannia flammicorona TaxID=994334 RepID=A0A433CY73_9FUNG|nr:LOW QUALITY PROTEIN: hypothetical protein BC936DRAFT_137036 [Jimgerdemannia flammicorona]